MIGYGSDNYNWFVFAYDNRIIHQLYYAIVEIERQKILYKHKEWYGTNEFVDDLALEINILTEYYEKYAISSFLLGLDMFKIFKEIDFDKWKAIQNIKFTILVLNKKECLVKKIPRRVLIYLLSFL